MKRVKHSLILSAQTLFFTRSAAPAEPPHRVPITWLGGGSLGCRGVGRIETSTAQLRVTTGAGHAGPCEECGRGDWDEEHRGCGRRVWVITAAGPHRSRAPAGTPAERASAPGVPLAWQPGGSLAFHHNLEIIKVLSVENSSNAVSVKVTILLRYVMSHDVLCLSLHRK